MKRFVSFFLIFLVFFSSRSLYIFSDTEITKSALALDVLSGVYVDYLKDSFFRKIDEDPQNDYTAWEEANTKAQIEVLSWLAENPSEKKQLEEALLSEVFLTPDSEFESIEDMPEEVKQAIKMPFFVPKSILKKYTDSLLEHGNVDLEHTFVGDFSENALKYMQSLDFSLNREGEYTNIVIIKNFHDGELVSVSTYFNVSVVGNIMTARKNEGSLMIVDSYVPWISSDGKPHPIDTWWSITDSDVVISNASIRTTKEKYFEDIIVPFFERWKNPYMNAPDGTVPVILPMKKKDLIQDPYDSKKFKVNPYLYQKNPTLVENKPKPNEKPHLFPDAIPGVPSLPNAPKPNYPFPNPPTSPDKPKFPEQNPDSPDDPEIPKLDFSPLYVPVPSKFPFCIPFDLANSLQIFKSQTAGDWEPVWVIPWSTAEVEVNLTKFSVLAKIVRYFVFAIFINGLIHATRNLIRG